MISSHPPAEWASPRVHDEGPWEWERREGQLASGTERQHLPDRTKPGAGALGSLVGLGPTAPPPAFPLLEKVQGSHLQGRFSTGFPREPRTARQAPHPPPPHVNILHTCLFIVAGP